MIKLAYKKGSWVILAVMAVLALLVMILLIFTISYMGNRTGAMTGSGVIGTQSNVTPGTAGPATNGQCMAVPYIKEVYGGMCGMASAAMVIAYFNKDPKYLNPTFQETLPLSAPTIAKDTGQPYMCDGNKGDIDAAVKSVQAGYPVIAYTNLYGQHIFVLTGYDEASQTFTANNPLPNGNSSQKCVTSIDGHTLTKAYLAGHIVPQACAFVLVKQ